MRLAILSDIHGNLEALKAVLADLDAQAVDRAASLGDVVGYGPQPEEVVRLLRERGIPSVMGNHELGLSSLAHMRWFNPPTRESLRITKKLLSVESLTWLAGLPRWLVLEGCRLVHGAPPDSVVTYLFEMSDADLARAMGGLAEDLCFVGHTHLLELVSMGQGRISRREIGEGELALETGVRHLVNAGAVGQPRDGDNRAKYVIWDSGTRRLSARRVPYDVAATATRIIALGFPDVNARRLW